MAQSRLKDECLSFYPPRSRWYSRFAWSLARPFGRYFNLDALQKSAPVSPGGLLLALALPGYAFFALQRRLFGWICLGCYVLALGVFLLAMGYRAGGIAYGLLISLHASSLIYLHNRWSGDCSFGRKLAFGFAILFVVWALFYAPVAGYTQRHWFLPMRTEDKVWVVKPKPELRAIRRGDYVLHQIEYQRGEGVYLAAGWGVDPVLALPGDHVRFTKAAVEVNGQLFPRSAYMPVNDELVVPQNVWLIWPELAITRRGAAPLSAIAPVMRELAFVKADQIVGKPYKHWFGRRQVP